jgi:hypothetical protein
VRLDVGDDVVRALVLGVLLTGGDLTGLRMDRLVSYQEQHPAPLQPLDADVRVVRIGPLGGRR